MKLALNLIAMGLGDESELYEAESASSDEFQRYLKVLQGGFRRLCDAKVAQEEKLVLLEGLLQSVVKTLERMEIHEGKRIEKPETSHHSPCESFTSEEPRRGPEGGNILLDNRASLLRRIEMLVFDGSLPYEWFPKVERFFRVGRYQDHDKLDLVSLSLEGDVLKWFNWEMHRQDFRSWDDFRQRLFLRFGESIDDDPGNRLFAIKQIGSVAAYVSEFEDLSTQVPGLDDSHLEKIFYNGLKQELKEVLKMKEPRGLPH